MEATFCVEILEDVIARKEKKNIYNKDQSIAVYGFGKAAARNNDIAISKKTRIEEKCLRRAAGRVKYEECMRDKTETARPALIGRYLSP